METSWQQIALGFWVGASIANGIGWSVPHEWKSELKAARVDRSEHIRMICDAMRNEMTLRGRPELCYDPFLEMLATQTCVDGTHRLITTNWDYLLQEAVDRWISRKAPGIAPAFLGRDSMVYHLNGTAEPGAAHGRSTFLLETDVAHERVAAHEANRAFNMLLWSTTVVVVGMSFECDVDRGLLGSLRHHQDNVPIGEAHFIFVEPSRDALKSTLEKFSQCFPRGSATRLQIGFAEWIALGAPELRGRILCSGNAVCGA